IEPEPCPGGKLMVALASSAKPKAQRRWLEQLAAWQQDDGLAALFFDSPESAKQARLVAELMGVS
ncbi:MAG: hypothetical protein HY083_11690, partial [Gammaproteobacteria bacterium]|nr:hypothetical protein [Gammaproteobacteria bacterium]